MPLESESAVKPVCLATWYMAADTLSSCKAAGTACRQAQCKLGTCKREASDGYAPCASCAPQQPGLQSHPRWLTTTLLTYRPLLPPPAEQQCRRMYLLIARLQALRLQQGALLHVVQQR